MDGTTSVSKGVFVFKNGFKNNKKHRKKTKVETSSSIFFDELWYQSFTKMWTKIDKQIELLSDQIYTAVLKNVVTFVGKPYNPDNTDSISTAVLLAGINVPDHGALFKNLKTQIFHEVTPHVVILHSEDCGNLKILVQNFIYRIIDTSAFQEDEAESIKKSACSFPLFEAWYQNEYPWIISNSCTDSPTKKRKLRRERRNVVIIFPDFEGLIPTVLQEFIMVVRSYLKTIPIIFVFGVATSMSTIVNNLPYRVSAKLTIQVFQSQQSLRYLNEVLENIFLTPDCPFHLSGKPFTLLTDVFLFYDFSVKGFIQGIKFAVCDHFYNNNLAALCCEKQDVETVLNKFTHSDFELVRRLRSFRPYVEAQEKYAIIQLLTNDAFLQNCLIEELEIFHEYLFQFHIVLKCLHCLMSTLPKSPFGKQYREFYAIAVSTAIVTTPEFKECMQMLSFLSKDELVEKIFKLCGIVQLTYTNSDNHNMVAIFKKLKMFLILIEKSTFEKPPSEEIHMNFESHQSRAELKQKLLQNSKQPKQLSEYETGRRDFLIFLSDTFTSYLKPPKCMPFHEIFFYSEVGNLKRHIVGSPRAAIHTSLHNPHFYLQCSCCALPTTTSILPTLPDVCIVYKLHLECGKLVNMYDWLQAFVTILDPDECEEERQTVKPEIQARFTRAIAELQFLGFIKTSMKKTDHVTRLTWG